MKQSIKDELVIVLAGEAGQGIQSIESILSVLLKRSGYYFFSTSEFMSRVRGGSNSTLIRISSKPVSGFVNYIDILIPLHKEALNHVAQRISTETVIFGDRSVINDERIINVQFNKLALECGNVIFSNTVAAGFICGLLDVPFTECERYVTEHFSNKTDDIQKNNLGALKKGYDRATSVNEISVIIGKTDLVKNQIVLSGAESIAFGAVAGGCNYVSGYPMSPSTSVLEKMASHSLKFDILVEQVEDEVGVINMALGAWYAGARAMVTTSGGGFALMCEGLSLCGMIESPLVIHLAQRPGPATGLPTRTEQGDLNMVLHAGHGDFPRIILAPGTPQEGFELARSAFSLADEFQVPVFILTDQYFVDCKFTIPCIAIPDTLPVNHIVETESSYRRFVFSPSGISPRGIPGYGKGLVCVDSDEHDESGHITEDLDLRVKMVDKRLSKGKALAKAIRPPSLSGPSSYSTLVICWGSTGPVVIEAVQRLKNNDIAVLHFSWIYPLSQNTSFYLKRASKIIIVENNATGQFAQLLFLSTGITTDKLLLKYNGLSFSVEEVAQYINKML